MNMDKADCDEKFLKDLELRALEDKKIKHSTSTNIKEIQVKLCNYCQFVVELEAVLMEMKNPDLENDEFDLLNSKANVLKSAISNLQNLILQTGLCSKVKDLIRAGRVKREKSRARFKLQRKNILKGNAIDDWRTKIINEEKTQRQDCAFRKEVDNILSEVLCKQSSLASLKGLLSATAKLRSVRLAKATDREMDSKVSCFDSLMGTLHECVERQKKEYDLEEATLRAMLEDKKAANNKLSATMPTTVSNLKQTVERILFGPESGNTGVMVEFFQPGLISREMLIETRREWDAFLHTRDHPLSSAVPVGWITPPIQPSDEWRKHQC